MLAWKTLLLYAEANELCCSSQHKKSMLVCASTENHSTPCRHKKPCGFVPARNTLLLCASSKKYVAMGQHQKPCSCVPTRKTLLLYASTKNAAALCHHKKPWCSMPTQKPCCSVPARKTMLARKIPAARCHQKNPYYSVLAQQTLMLYAKPKKTCCSMHLKKLVWHSREKTLLLCPSTKNPTALCEVKKGLVLCGNKKTPRKTSTLRGSKKPLLLQLKKLLLLCASTKENPGALCQPKKQC